MASTAIRRNAESRLRRRLLIVFVIAHAAYAAMAFTVPLVTAGVPVPLFDLRLFRGYDVVYAETFLAAIGAAGRRLYFLAQLPLDVVYPVGAGLFFAGLLHRRLPRRTGFALLGFLPTAADLLENGLVALLIGTGRADPTVVALASAATVLKSFAYVAAYGFAIAVGATGLVRAVSARSRRKEKP